MIYLSLGSNLGDREAYLNAACKVMERLLRVELVRSEIIETEAVGFEGPAFLNMAVAFEAPVWLTPEGLLDFCQSIEMELGRAPHQVEFNADGTRRYTSRTIDIDILKYDDVEISTPRLVLPHPQVESRPFVALLLKDLETKIEIK